MRLITKPAESVGMLLCKSCHSLFALSVDLQFRVWKSGINKTLYWYGKQLGCCGDPDLTWVSDDHRFVVEEVVDEV